jgi:hypothetical protein
LSGAELTRLDRGGLIVRRGRQGTWRTPFDIAVAGFSGRFGGWLRLGREGGRVSPDLCVRRAGGRQHRGGNEHPS